MPQDSHPRQDALRQDRQKEHLHQDRQHPKETHLPKPEDLLQLLQLALHQVVHQVNKEEFLQEVRLLRREGLRQMFHHLLKDALLQVVLQANKEEFLQEVLLLLKDDLLLLQAVLHREVRPPHKEDRLQEIA